MSSTILLRPAQEADVLALNSIHTHYVKNTVSTFALVPATNAQTKDKLEATRLSGLPYIVAIDTSSDIPEPIGYVYASYFRSALEGYAHTVELSLYCHPEQTRKGLGSALLLRILDVLRNPETWGEEWISGKARKGDGRIREVILCMGLDETGSKGGWGLKEWYERFGFEQTGHLKKVGRKFERWIDTVYLQLSL